jgi:hypothetical protein
MTGFKTTLLVLMAAAFGSCASMPPPPHPQPGNSARIWVYRIAPKTLGAAWNIEIDRYDAGKALPGAHYFEVVPGDHVVSLDAGHRAIKVHVENGGDAFVRIDLGDSTALHLVQVDAAIARAEIRKNFDKDATAVPHQPSNL